MKVAVIVFEPLIVKAHEPVPEQAPLQPPNFESGIGVALRVRVVPVANAAKHVRQQKIPPGVLDTSPCPVPASFTVSPKYFTPVDALLSSTPTHHQRGMAGIRAETKFRKADDSLFAIRNGTPTERRNVLRHLKAAAKKLKLGSTSAASAPCTRA